MNINEKTRPPGRALFEITARCDLRCDHCLVAGGKALKDELSTDQALDLIDQIANLGIGTVTVTGGEPFLRKDWALLAGRVREHGMTLKFSANGHYLDDGVLTELVELQTKQFAVSLDGTKTTHDSVRHGPGSKRGPSSFERVMDALERLRRTPIISTVITAVGRHNLDELPRIHSILKDKGVEVWMIQLAHRTGRLSTADEASAATPISPEQLVELEAFLAGAARDRMLAPLVHNTIGYMSANEPILRSSGKRGPARFWRGCQCGVTSIGIAPDGGIKGCANQIGAPFTVGNIKTESLRAIWEDRERWRWLYPPDDEMDGSCRGCALASICRGGCKALAFGATGSYFDNPYCLRKLSRVAKEEKNEGSVRNR